ncbi:MAG: oligoribonuclease [Oligoflexus sp.]
MSEKNADNLVWIDMEMSGLFPETDVVLEIATIVTDKELNILAEGPSLVIGHEASLFDRMDEWNQEHHVKSGLWEKVVRSVVSLAEAEKQTIEFLNSYTLARQNPLCGNSIAQDRMFINRYFPKLNQHLHYRMIDVSSIKELVKRWYPDGPNAPAKQNNHRALDDIRESIEELKFYRQTYFFHELPTKPSGST